MNFKKNKNNNNSVIQIPRLDVGNKHNYNNINYNFETLKYNYFYDKRVEKPNFTNNRNMFNFETKHFFDPNNSKYSSGHTSEPINNTKIISEYNILKYTGKYFNDKIDNIMKYNLILVHFDTKDKNINDFKNSHHRSECIHRNRKMLNIINKKLGSLTIKNDIFIKYSKNIFKKYFNENGYLICRNIFSKEKINDILEQAKNIYRVQFNRLNIKDSFNNSMKQLFKDNLDVF